MKFILLKSRGGDYLVVAANIAYLRADENGQTKVGMAGARATNMAVAAAGCASARSSSGSRD